MLKYNPEKAPNPEVWLAAEEDERIDAVLHWHRKARVELPNEMLHALVHVVVENQLAEEHPPVVSAIPRLMQQGLTRHEAVHAVATALTDYYYEMSRDAAAPQDPDALQAHYDAIVDSLTADGWRSMLD